MLVLGSLANGALSLMMAPRSDPGKAGAYGWLKTRIGLRGGEAAFRGTPCSLEHRGHDPKTAIRQGERHGREDT